MTLKKQTFQELSTVELQTVSGGFGVLTGRFGLIKWTAEQVANIFKQQ